MKAIIIGGIVAVAMIGAVVAATMYMSNPSLGTNGKNTNSENNNVNATGGKKYTVGLNENLGLKEKP